MKVDWHVFPVPQNAGAAKVDERADVRGVRPCVNVRPPPFEAAEILGAGERLSYTVRRRAF